MNNHPDVATDSTAVPSHWIWVSTLAVAGVPVVFGLYQVWTFFDEAFPHLYWSRTLPALAGVTLAIAGIAAPLWVLIKRESFSRWSRARQWQTCGAILLLMFLAYFVPFVMLAEAARKAHAILSYTPSVFLEHRPHDEWPFFLGVIGGLGNGLGRGEKSKGNDEVIVEWTAWLEPPELARPPGLDPVVQLRCEATQDTDSLSVKMEINTGRTVRFDIRGFIDPNIQQHGKPIKLPIEIGAGTHRFTIRAKL